MPTSQRLISLDVFRGITIALMILVNSPGNSSVYTCLEHSAWNGCTLADFVFPFFIFIVGISSVFSLSKARHLGMTIETLLPKIFKRSLWLFLIGLLLNAFPNHFDLETLRIWGVLQRIAICYFVASLLFLTTTVRTQVLITIFTLVSYWLIVDYFSIKNYTETDNIAAIIDRWMLSAPHLYGKTYDPEGFLSTFPSIATALIGNLTGIWLLSKRKRQTIWQGLIIAGILGLCAGDLWNIVFPMNKSLWSSSYVLWTAGAGLLLLACCYGLIEIKGYTKWSRCFEIFGVNAVAAYILHVVFLKIQFKIQMTLADGTNVNLKLWLTDHLFGWASPINASLLYALSYTAFWFVILLILYRQKIFIKL